MTSRCISALPIRDLNIEKPIYSKVIDLVCSALSAKMEKEAGASGMGGLFTYSNLVHAVSGATGSVIAISVFYPLDTVRTRLQVDDHRRAKNTFQICKDIFKEEGFSGVYRGWLSLAQATTVSSFLYFYIYASFQLIHHHLRGDTPTSATVFFDLIIAFAAGIVNVLLTTPLWVANTRLKLQGAKLHTQDYKTDGQDNEKKKKYDGMIDCLLKILHREGVQKLWSGTVPSLLLASNPAIQFMVYEFLKRYFKQALHVQELGGFLYFLIGAVAKAVATVITYPLQVVQSRLRAGYAKLETSQTLIENLLHLVKTRGVGALYKGMEAKLLQTVLTAALMFYTYEKIAAFIFRLMGM